jgi:hypothetical protein
MYIVADVYRRIVNLSLLSKEVSFVRIHMSYNFIINTFFLITADVLPCELFVVANRDVESL